MIIIRNVHSPLLPEFVYFIIDLHRGKECPKFDVCLIIADGTVIGLQLLQDDGDVIELPPFLIREKWEKEKN